MIISEWSQRLEPVVGGDNTHTWRRFRSKDAGEVIHSMSAHVKGGLQVLKQGGSEVTGGARGAVAEGVGRGASEGAEEQDPFAEVPDLEATVAELILAGATVAAVGELEALLAELQGGNCSKAREGFGDRETWELRGGKRARERVSGVRVWGVRGERVGGLAPAVRSSGDRTELLFPRNQGFAIRALHV
ncbi:hypothetical protein F2Q69_00024937 [Brassica cretica]|uniref:Uncharacterized protein n=1 Tax=Brassica cretica TaxID=69181 RepID=A0A8S9QIA5_BRACR|nr:hypothetical protein F2Q69_00024937 [Brassica cretica]